MSFNPRVREGRDVHVWQLVGWVKVSIHASARDATLTWMAPVISALFQSTRLRWTRRGRRGTDAPTCGFNPRVREGRDDCLCKPHCVATGFNPRVREGRDSDAMFRCSGLGCFNPRVREGRDYRRQEGIIQQWVSIHASARDATRTALKAFGDWVFQSTRPRGTRPDAHRSLPPAHFVSIHASARDATRPPRPPRQSKPKVSIHASARDATDLTILKSQSVICFNPRVREGRDKSVKSVFQPLRVSIHASARDATSQSRPR